MMGASDGVTPGYEGFPYAYTEGFEAYEAGTSVTLNPFVEGTVEWDDWSCGWAEAEYQASDDELIAAREAKNV